MTVCIRCGQSYQSHHCMSCHRSFSGQEAFDRHRTGTYAPDTRRCLTDTEMQSSGKWRLTPKGLTDSEPMSPEAKGRLRHV